MYKIEKKFFDSMDIHIVNRLSEHAVKTHSVINQKYAFFKEMIFRMTLKKVVIKHVAGTKNNAVCIFKNCDIREDCLTIYKNIYQSTKRVGWMLEYKTITVFNPVRSLYILGCLLSHLSLFRNLHGSLKWSFICSFIITLDFSSEIKSYDFSNTNLGVVLYDLASLDCLFVHYLKMKGITTATLQHGMTCEQNVASLMYGYADYFLVMNQLTRDEAIQAGIPEEKIKIMGNPKYAYQDHMGTRKTTKKNTFGVILPGGNSDEIQKICKELIKYSNLISDKLNIPFYIKYHPSTRELIYDDFPNKKYFLGHLPLNSSVLEYADLVDFTLIAISTVFVELLYLGHPVYRMCVETNADPYKKITKNSFHNMDELIELIQNNAETQNELFEYICHTRTPEQNFENFFEEYR